MTFDNKLVAILNKDIEIGVALNALAHTSLVLGSQIQWDHLRIETYRDTNDQPYPISAMPFMILRGKSNEIRKLSEQIKDRPIKSVVFLNTMTGGTYVEQMERTRTTPPEDFVFYNIVLFGPWDEVSQLTRKFSLYKDKTL